MRHKAFFDHVRKARESCAGDTSMHHTTRQVKNFLNQAILIGRRDDVPLKFVDLCRQALDILDIDNTFNRRVEADQLLCKVLNTMLAQERGDAATY